MISLHQNVGSLDRFIRFILSLFLIGLGLFGSYSLLWQALLLVIGAGELATSIIAY